MIFLFVLVSTNRTTVLFHAADNPFNNLIDVIKKPLKQGFAKDIAFALTSDTYTKELRFLVERFLLILQIICIMLSQQCAGGL